MRSIQVLFLQGPSGNIIYAALIVLVFTTIHKLMPFSGVPNKTAIGSMSIAVLLVSREIILFS